MGRESVDVQGRLSPSSQYTALILAPRRVKVQPYTLFHFHHVPSFCRRDAILEGYRRTTSFQHSVGSIFRMHNETINIWSHLVGAWLRPCSKCASATCLGQTMPSMVRHRVDDSMLGQVRQQQAFAFTRGVPVQHDHAGACITILLAVAFACSIFSVVDLVLLFKTGTVSPHSRRLAAAAVPKLPILLFDMCTTTTMLLSATAHTFSCMPRAVSATLWRLDQAGIGLGVFGCFIPGTFYSFYCYPPGTSSRYLFVTWFMVVACAIMNAVLSCWVPARFIRSLRVASYVLLSCTAVVPVAEIVTNQGTSCALQQTMVWIGACACLAAAGGFFYASGVPERWYPGKYDLLGTGRKGRPVPEIIAKSVHISHAAVALREHIDPAPPRGRLFKSLAT